MRNLTLPLVAAWLLPQLSGVVAMASTDAGSPPPPPIAAITRGPYLQSAAQSGIVVRWRTDVLSEGRVRFGLEAANLQWEVSNSTPTTEHSITLTNLAPDTKYFYAIAAGAAILSGGSDYNFRTAPILAKPTRIWAIGDAGTASVGSTAPVMVRDAYAAFTGTNRTDVWLMLGDNAYYSGTDSEYQAAVFNVFQDLLRTTPVWPTIGNHETYAPGPGGGLAYFDIFSLPQNGQAGGVPSGTERYYSFDHGAIHFVCLDSELSDRTPSGPMLTWLEADLAASGKDWTIAYWHSPPYSKGSHDSDFEGNLVQMRESVVPVLESYGVDLVLCGHSHSYERSYLLNGHYGLSSTLASSMIRDDGSGRDGDTGAYTKPPTGTGEGTVYVVAGSAGQTSGGSLNHPAMFVSLNRLGSMVIDVSSNRLEAAFLRETGAMDDRFTIIKGTLPPSITSGPASQTTIVGRSPTLSVVAAGTKPLSYQWFFDGAALPAGTNGTLSLPNVQFNQAGPYWVVVANQSGSVTSSVAVLTVNPVPPCYSVPAGLVSWWPGDGTAEDVVGGNHGELRNGVGFAPGMAGQGFLFDGVNDYLSIPDSPSLDLTNEVTVELWFRRDKPWIPDTQFTLFDKRGGGRANYGATLSVNYGLILYFQDPQYGGFQISYYSPLPSINTFHHFAGVYRQIDSSHVELRTYIDGILVKTAEFDGRLANSTTDNQLTIGGAQGVSDFFEGIIDEVGIYNRALSAAEIVGVVNAGPAGKCLTNLPPTIVAGPANRTVYAGATVTFSVTAGGGRPLAYQWIYNGADLPDATAATLTITNVQESQGGVYAVRVSNMAGSVTSSDAVLVVNRAPACLSVPPGLVSWWPGDGTAEDVVGGNHGELRNGVGFAPGMAGQGFLFDGVNDYVSIPDSPSLDLTNEVTVELWFRRDKPWVSDTQFTLFDKRGGGYANYGASLSVNYGLSLYFQDPQFGDFKTSHYFPLPSINVFHHFAGVYQQIDSSHVELRSYLDGLLVKTAVFDGRLANSTTANQLTIGGAQGVSDFFEGIIDEVGIYNRALSAAEIVGVVNAGPAGKCLTDSPPVIVIEPEGSTVTVGATATISVTAAGSRPLAYQWYLNNTSVADATNSVLVINNIQYGQAGGYRVVVTNSVGSVTSSVVPLVVLPPPTQLRVVDASGPAGGSIELPIELTAQGFENALGFSIQFDASLLAFQFAALAGQAPVGATLIVNSNEATVGRVGLAVALPADLVFPPGTSAVIRVTFKGAVVQSAVTTPVTFVDQPTTRQVSDVLAQALDLASVNGTIQILRVPFEADVTPRPSGDFAVSIVDWVQTGRFVAGLDQAAPGEFQRLDSAPRDSGGNGIISVTDWVQAGRYAAGVDPLTPVGGPSEPVAPSPVGRFLAQASGPRTLALPVTNAAPGTSVSVPVRLAAQGNENAIGFSVVFAPGSLVFDSLTTGSSASGATLNGNANQAGSGRVGVVLALPSGTTFAAGAREIAQLNFRVATNATGIIAVNFGDQPVIREVSDASAHSLSCAFAGGYIAVGDVPAGPTLSARRAGGSLLLFWPSSATGFDLYSASSISGGPWVKAQVSPIDIGGQFIVSLPTTNSQQYYRLLKP